MKFGEALRLLRTRQGLTQAAASQRPSAPEYRTLSMWENGHKLPRLGLLGNYLKSMDLDFSDLQDALDHVQGTVPRRFREGIERLERQVGEVVERMGEVEKRVGLGGVEPVDGPGEEGVKERFGS